MLEINDLHVEVKGTPVLKGIDLHIKPGETFILFGPNGSGKTTLLMTLMGVSGYAVTRGQIIFKGTDITHAPMYERARLGLGFRFGGRCDMELAARVAEQAERTYPHYFKDVSDVDAIDLYHVARLYDITDPALFHAFKKIACAGKRGAKDRAQDVQEAIDALKRWQELNV